MERAESFTAAQSISINVRAYILGDQIQHQGQLYRCSPGIAHCPLEERNAEMKLHLLLHRELLSPVLGYFHPVSHSVCLRYIPQRTAPSYTYGRCHSVAPMLEKHIPHSMCIFTVSSTVKWRQMEAKMILFWPLSGNVLLWIQFVYV